MLSFYHAARRGRQRRPRPAGTGERRPRPPHYALPGGIPRPPWVDWAVDRQEPSMTAPPQRPARCRGSARARSTAGDVPAGDVPAHDVVDAP
ncbi:hypothetical protein GCM10009696_29380 [Kocuria himachalensis]